MANNISNKNIWVFHHYATPSTMSGLPRTYNLAEGLIKAGYNVKIFASSHLHYTDINLINDNRLYITNDDTNIPFVFVKTYSSSGNGIGRVINMVSYYINLLKVAKKFIKQGETPDLIISSSPQPLALVAGIKVAKKLKIPCISEIRDFWPEVFFLGRKVRENSILGKVLVQGEYWIYRNSDAIIFLKEGDYTYITDKKWDIAQGGKIDLDKCYYINNGVDIETFNKQIKENTVDDPDLNNNKFNVVYIGAIRQVNNVGNILDAAKVLSNKKNIQFLIYGNGNQFQELQDRITSEDITNIKMKGYIDKQYIPYILSKSSVNLLNYSQTQYNWKRGNSSNKLFEYMASGKPIISTVVMGYSPIEKYDCGVSLENDTPEELAKAILGMYNMSCVRYAEIGENARKGAKDFDYKELTKKLIAVMENLL